MLLEIVAFLLSFLIVICFWLIIECNRIVNRYEYLEIKAEAIKEFVERLKEKGKAPFGEYYGKIVREKDIDSLVKEMVGDV